MSGPLQAPRLAGAPAIARSRTRHVPCAIVASLLAFVSFASPARAEGNEKPSWKFAPVYPARLPDGQESKVPVALGKIGDIEFSAPNRGLLITAGNGETVKPGVWTYNGKEWSELAEVCGATDGRIAWAGPDEFWTVSDGRPGQASSEGLAPPLADNTLCHFAVPAGQQQLQVVGSYASLAFRADSYQAMHAAGCLSPGDCWFAGELLPNAVPGAGAQIGAFQLHWNGSSLTAEPYPAEHKIEDMRRFGRYLFQSVQIGEEDQSAPGESPSSPSLLHLITPIGVQPTFVSLTPGVPQYAPKELPSALEFLHLSADEEALWGVADPSLVPAEHVPGEVTILRDSGGLWSQVLGYGSDPPGGNPFTQHERSEQDETATAIAAEPGSANAWLALTSRENRAAAASGTARAMVGRVSADGEVAERQALPAGGETGPKGPADKIVCPASNDCWLTTTQGWLFHLTTESGRRAEEADPDTDAAFSGLITSRPPDAGLPAVVPDAPPEDDSGLLGEPPPSLAAPVEVSKPENEAKVPVPLLSHMRTRLVHRTTLELSFHLAVKARVRLIARRGKRVVASTPLRTLAAGNHRLLLVLNLRSWPKKLELQTHALARLPTTSTRGPGTNMVGTGLRALPRTPSFAEAGRLP